MTADELDRRSEAITELVSDLMDVNAVYRHQDKLLLSLSHHYRDRRKVVKLLSDRLKMAGYRFELNERDQEVVISVDPRRRLRVPTLNIVLFIVTLISIYVVPVFTMNFLSAESFNLAFDGALDDFANGAGIIYTLALISILLVHEMGHFVASRRRNIITSWPYFIPAPPPNILGTFGAVIKSKSPFRLRRDLIEVGAAGPLAGWIIALGWLVYGLSQSSYLQMDIFPPKVLAFSMDGESILMRLFTYALIGPAPAGHYYILNEAALAGWVGMLVTAINMLPIGQLDGGHVLYGLTRRWQHILAGLAMGALIVLGFQSPMWWMFALFGLIFGVKHPPTLDDSIPLTRCAKVMAIASIVILILSFTPAPFR